MIKKLGLLFSAVAVLAFAVPAFANAATGLTEAGGVPVPVGAKLEYTSLSSTTITSTKTGNIVCAKSTLTGTVTINNSSHYLVTQSGLNNTISECKASGGSATVKNISGFLEEGNGGGTGAFVISFTVVLPGGLECKYSMSGGVFTYNPAETADGSDVLTIASQPMTVTPAACGTTAQLDTRYTRETDETTIPVYLM
jgi:hypothetical protein